MLSAVRQAEYKNCFRRWQDRWKKIVIFIGEYFPDRARKIVGTESIQVKCPTTSASLTFTLVIFVQVGESPKREY